MLSKAQPLSKPAVMDKILGSTSGLFGDINANPFGNIGAGPDALRAAQGNLL